MDIPIELLPVQMKFLTAQERTVAIVSSRSCGKSYVQVLGAIVDMLQGKNNIYMCQTLDAWTKGPWLHLQRILDVLNLRSRWRWNEAKHIGYLDTDAPQPSKLYLGTYEAPDSGRGGTEVSTLRLDEFMLSNPDDLASFAPCLRGRDNYYNLISPRYRYTGTPDMTSKWIMKVLDAEKYGIRVLRSKMTENKFISDEQREAMASQIFNPKLYAQEIEGEIIVGEDATAIIHLNEFPTRPGEFADERVFVGIDAAGFGTDRSVICVRKGNRILALYENPNLDGYECKRKVRELLGNEKPSGIFIDMAYGQSFYDQLKYEYPNVRMIQFASAPENRDRFVNIRAEMYFNTADAIRDGLFIESEEIRRDMCSTHFKTNSVGRFLIQPKDELKEIFGHSPDLCDALVLTYADGYNREYGVTVQAKTNATLEEKRRKGRSWMG